MRKSRCTEEQIVAIVRESETPGMTVAEVAKKHGVDTTLFRCRYHRDARAGADGLSGGIVPAARIS